MAKQTAQKEDDLELGVSGAGAAKKKLIIIGAVVLVLLIGAGVAAWLLLGGHKDEGGKEQSGAAHAEAVHVDKGAVTYQPLTSVFVVNLPGHPRLLQVGLVVRFYYPKLGEFLQHNDPALRNGVLNLLSGQDGQALSTRQGKEKLRAALKKEINQLIHRYHGPGEIDQVYYSSFVTQ
jgi:flagellar protein FliL